MNFDQFPHFPLLLPVQSHFSFQVLSTYMLLCANETPQIRENTHYLTSWFWLRSLTMIIYSFIFFSGNGVHNFFFVAEYNSILYVYQISLLNSMYRQHLSAIASNAAIIAHAHMHPCDMPTCSKGGTAGPLDSSTARPWGTSTQTSIVGGPVYKSSVAVPKPLPFSSVLPGCYLFSWWPLFWAGWGGLSL